MILSEFYAILDLTVVLSEEAYLSDAVIYYLFDGDFIQTDCCLDFIRSLVLYIPCIGPVGL